MHGFFSPNFSCCFLWDIRADVFFFYFFIYFFLYFLILGKKLGEGDFLRTFFVYRYINMGPYGSENFYTLLLIQIAVESFQTFPECWSQWSSQNYVAIFEILSLNIYIFSRKFQIYHCSLWRNQTPQLSGKRAIVEQNGVKFGTRR